VGRVPPPEFYGLVAQLIPVPRNSHVMLDEAELDYAALPA
jgi:hypothetical protein